MKSNNAIIITAQALSITSQLLAIGIEVGILAGGYLLYKKLTETPEPATATEQKQTKLDKIKRIWRAVVS